MRIVFMGSPDFAIPSLEKLHQSEHDIAAVVSNVDKRRGRGSELKPTQVKKKALELDLPVIEVEGLDDPEVHRKLESLNADLFVVVAFRILPPEMLSIPKKGSVNLHASLLPKYRGAAPIHWAVMEGDEKTGCTIFFLDKNVDTGNIITQRETHIGPNETTGDLYKRLKNLGSEALFDAVQQIGNDEYETIPQDDSRATPAPKLFTDDCKIDFDQQASIIHNKIRGLSPFPTAWAKLGDKKFNMYRSELASDISLPTGQLEMRNGNLMAGCASGSVILNEVQLQGKKRMPGKDFMNGYQGRNQLN